MTRMKYHGTDMPMDKIAAFCCANRIRRLALFGSILRDDFGPDSDINGGVRTGSADINPHRLRSGPHG